jgi:hypothetical protein
LGFLSPRQFCEAVYCAFAPSDAFDQTADGRIAFSTEAMSAGMLSRHDLVFVDVHGFTRKPPVLEPVDPGDRLELSVVELEREPSGWRVWFNPWYITEIEFRCQQIFLDGAEVRGEGRWLQDDLPKPTLSNER